MSQIKIKNNNLKRLTTATEHVGFTLMTIAALAGLIEVHDRPLRTAVVSPVFAFAIEGSGSNPLRREREEVGPHYVSYSAVQRTPGRTGKY